MPLRPHHRLLEFVSDWPRCVPQSLGAVAVPDEIEWNFDIDDSLLAVAYVEHGLTEREVHPDCPELAQAVRAALLMRAAVPVESPAPMRD